MAGGLPESEAMVNSCKLASPKRCKNSAVVKKEYASRAVGKGRLRGSTLAAATQARNARQVRS
jgi:hypothetical protein